jgi:hypothetical protein
MANLLCARLSGAAINRSWLETTAALPQMFAFSRKGGIRQVDYLPKRFLSVEAGLSYFAPIMIP